MQAKFVIIDGAKKAKVALRLPTVIGRSADAALKVPGHQVSRNHCEVYEYEGELCVRDLGSTNGTLVNGQPIDDPTLLTPDDRLTVGPVTMQVALITRKTKPKPAPAPAPKKAAPPKPAPEPEPAVSDEFPMFDDEDGGPIFEDVEESSAVSVVEYTDSVQGSFIAIDEVEEIEDIEDSAEVEEFTTAEDVEDIEDAEDVEEVAEVEDVEEVAEFEDITEVADVADVEEVEEVEDVEEEVAEEIVAAEIPAPTSPSEATIDFTGIDAADTAEPDAGDSALGDFFKSLE